MYTSKHFSWLCYRNFELTESPLCSYPHSRRCSPVVVLIVLVLPGMRLPGRLLRLVMGVSVVVTGVVKLGHGLGHGLLRILNRGALPESNRTAIKIFFEANWFYGD